MPAVSVGAARPPLQQPPLPSAGIGASARRLTAEVTAAWSAAGDGQVKLRPAVGARRVGSAGLPSISHTGQDASAPADTSSKSIHSRPTPTVTAACRRVGTSPPRRHSPPPSCSAAPLCLPHSCVKDCRTPWKTGDRAARPSGWSQASASVTPCLHTGGRRTLHGHETVPMAYKSEPHEALSDWSTRSIPHI